MARLDSQSEREQFAKYAIYRDCEVFDVRGTRIGSVRGLWLHVDTDEPEFLLVEAARAHTDRLVVPTQKSRRDGRNIQVPFSEETVRAAPRFSPDHVPTAHDVFRMHEHYQTTWVHRRQPDVKR